MILQAIKHFYKKLRKRNDTLFRRKTQLITQFLQNNEQVLQIRLIYQNLKNNRHYFIQRF